MCQKNKRFTDRRISPAGRVFRLLCIAGLLGCQTASAQTAIELFNPAAREYIYGNTPAASNLVHQALEKYPDDERLQKLKELIEQQQDQQNQQQQNQDQQQQDRQQQNQDQQQDQSDKSDPSDLSDETNQEQEQEQQQQEPQEAESNPAQPRRAGEMTPEEAQQLLDAMKQNEQDRRADLQPYLGAPVRVDKDW